MNVTTETVIVLHLSEKEAGMLLAIARSVSGDPASVARRFTDDLAKRIAACGVVRVEAFSPFSGMVAMMPEA